MKESDFKFLGYRISKIECDINDKFGLSTEKIKQEINVENNFQKSQPRFVEVVLNVTVKSDSENFRFFIRIKGGFQGNEKMSENSFKILSSQNGPAILFPFARSIITSNTAQANIPPIILPTINFANSSLTEKVNQ